MGIEWGGKGPKIPVESSKPVSRFDRLLNTATDIDLQKTEHDTRQEIAGAVGELTTKEMLDLMAPAPKDPPKSLRTLE